jgi:hypothetical protein
MEKRENLGLSTQVDTHAMQMMRNSWIEYVHYVQFPKYLYNDENKMTFHPKKHIV